MNDNRFSLRHASRSTSSSPSLSSPVLPHHRLIAYGVARDLLLAVLACRIRDAKLRDEAVRSAKSACLNCAEGAGRVTRADKARAFAIARAEAVEAAAAVEIAALCGDAPAAPAGEVTRVADRLVALLTGLVRQAAGARGASRGGAPPPRGSPRPPARRRCRWPGDVTGSAGHGAC